MAEAAVENVRDYPRPPAIEPVGALVAIDFGGRRIAQTHGAFRILETFHPPTYYIPRDAILPDALEDAAGSSLCEWKGRARYFDVVGGDRRAAKAAWAYDEPSAAYRQIAGFVAFYAEPMDACFVGAMKVAPQPGNFYGGWVTANITGPIKGAPGTTHW